MVEETRRREAYEFDTITEVYQATTRAIEEAVVILEEIWAGEATFAQMSQHMNGILKNVVKLKKVYRIAPVMSALA